MKDSRSAGMTVVELLVGVLVGVIVLTIAISILVSTNSTSRQLMSRQEISTSTRIAFTQILKDLGSAQSMLECIVWKDSTTQTNYQAYKNNNAPTFAHSASDCLEYQETGVVLHYADGSAVCWYKDLTGGSGVIDFNREPIMSCLALTDSEGNSTAPQCSSVLSNAKESTIYYYECRSAGGFSYFLIPEKISAASFTDVNEGSLREIAQLNPHGADEEEFEIPETIFLYEKVGGSTYDPETSDPDEIKKIENVTVTLDIIYRAARGSGLNDSDYNIYRYSNKVLLQGMRSYIEQGAYGRNF